MKENPREFRTVRGYQIKQQIINPVTASMEDYIEMIYRQADKGGYTRISNLAAALNVQPPSASRMVQKLAEMGYVQFEKYGVIELSKSGQSLGAYLLRRHETLERFFSMLGVSENRLEETEKIEHYISLDTIQKISLLLQFMENNPDCLDKLGNYLHNPVCKP